MANHRIARIVGLIQIYVASLESVWLSMLPQSCISLKVTFIHPFYFIVESYWPMYILMELFSLGLRYQKIPPPVIYGHHPGHSTFVVVVVARDVRGESPKWPGALVFRGGYHPRKTSCKRTFKTHPKHVFSRWVYDPKYVFFSLDLFIKIYRGALRLWLVSCTPCATDLEYQKHGKLEKRVTKFTFLRHNVNAHYYWA